MLRSSCDVDLPNDNQPSTLKGTLLA